MEQLTQTDAVSRVYACLRGWGVSESSASCIAEHLVDSELSGHPSHGVRQLIRYERLVVDGQCDPAADPVVLALSGPVARIDGQGGFGQPAMRLAVDTAVEAAREYKVGVAGVVRIGHTGRMGAWVERGTAAGVFALAMLAASDPPFALAAAPGAAPVLRTNPLSIGAPSTKDPLILDIAMSVVSESAVLDAASRGEQVPENALTDGHGNVSTDPRDYLDGGVLLPTGGYKGFGLAVLIEALSIGLTGADEHGRTPVSGALVICIDCGAFRAHGESKRSVEALQERVRASGDFHSVVQAPGDRSKRRRANNIVTFDDDVLALLHGSSTGSFRS